MMLKRIISNRYFFYISFSLFLALLSWIDEGIYEENPMEYFKNNIDYIFNIWGFTYLTAFVAYEVKEKKKRKKENKEA